jgi:hypothetical protein
MIILRKILEREYRVVYLGLILLVLGASGELCEHGNESSSYIHYWRRKECLISCATGSFSKK